MLPTGHSPIPNGHDDDDQRADAPQSDSDPSILETLAVSPSQVAIPRVSSRALQVLSYRYDILAEAGRGAMGQVYKARDRETGETVALKVLKAEISSDPAMVERFKNELLFTRRITHKNVGRLYEFNRVDGIAYTSMEFVEGESLRSVLKRFGSITLRKGADIALQICSGLKEAHAQGIVHRDLKPENVMIDTKGNVKILDFGIARSMETLTLTTGALIGTPAYMAPEQAAGKSVDHRADIYALGLMLYEMFTGMQAFRGDNAISVALKQMNEAPRAPREIEPSISPAIERAILRCLEKDPDNRFQSVAGLESGLLSTDSSGAGAPGPAAIPTMSAPAVTSFVTASAGTPVHVSPGGRQSKRRSRVFAILLVVFLVFTVRDLWQHLIPQSAGKSDSGDIHLNTVTVTKDSVSVKEGKSSKPVATPETKASRSPAVSSYPAAASAAAARRSKVVSEQSFAPSQPVRNSSSAQVEAPEPGGAPPVPAPSGDMAALDGAVPEPSRPPAGTGGYIWVNRFPRQAGAQNAAKKIEDMGLPATVIPRHNPANSTEFFVVLSGPFPKPKIESVLDQLKSNGFPLARFNRAPAPASALHSSPN